MQLWLLFSFLAVLFFSMLLPQTTSAEHPMSREHQVARELFAFVFDVAEIALRARQFREDQIVSLLTDIGKGQDANKAYQNSFRNAFYKGVRREIKDEACKYLVPDGSGRCANEVVCEFDYPFLVNSSCGDDQPYCKYSLPDTNEYKQIKSAVGVCNDMCYEYNPDDTCPHMIQGKLVEASDAASSSTSFLRLPIIFALASTSFAIASLC